MASPKLRKFKFWRVKWILLYVAVVLLYVFAFVSSAFYFDDPERSFILAYELAVILFSIWMPVAILIECLKEKKEQKRMKN